ncbi:MAG: hypothetical protein ACKVS9_14305 [Phycisphaerae bacterium]
MKSDSRSPYVHRLTLYDHQGKAIDPTAGDAPPYSPQATCGKCHEVGLVGGGWHFNACQPDVDAGRAGEPWLLSDARFGMSVPISGRGWPGAFKPEQVGLSAWQMTLTFGHHSPGGGYGELDDETLAKTAEAKRWEISGKLEVDCMMCHAADRSYDPAEVARQLERENLRWTPTAAIGLAAIRGDAKRVPDNFDPMNPSNDPAQSPPTTIYDKTRFDGDNRVHFDVVRQPASERCYFCHTTRPVGHDAPTPWKIAGDVHLAAGLDCADCHRNDITHAITRGYNDPADVGRSTHETTLTCEGCHLGWVNGHPAAGDGAATAGTYGAPYPQHAGIPPLHFEKMTCTACHSGPWPDVDGAQTVQTSLAHKLGIGTKDRTDEQPPQIVEPVFSRDEAGRVAPYRQTWPAYWAVKRGDKLEPIAIETVRKLAAKALPKPRGKEALPPLSDEQIAQTLVALAKAAEGDGATVVYVRDHQIHQLDASGKRVSAAHAEAKPYRWALAHDVRPASQSLGVRGCTDCHAADGAIFFGIADVRPTSQPATSRPATPMYQLIGYDARLAQMWSLGLAGKPAFLAVATPLLALLVAGLIARLANWMRGGA